MTGVVITGWSAVSSAGIGVQALTERLAGVELSSVPASAGIGVEDLYADPLPGPAAHAVADFNVREHLGRKGTSTYDRVTGLAVVCTQDALREAQIAVEEGTRARVGVALGTSLGSYKSTSDYSAETLTQEKPYYVNPMLFPNTVMNGAAGQVAIRFGLRAVNATIAGGTLAFLNAVRYATNIIARGYADVMLTGAVEEFTPHRAWATHLTGATGTVAAGEAAGVFVLARPGVDWAGPRSTAEILGVATGYGPGGGERTGEALAACVRRALQRAGVNPAEVSTVLTGEVDDADVREYGPTALALGHEPKRVMPKRLLGECDAASGAVALAVLLASGGIGVSGDGVSLLTARGADGAVGAAIVKGSADGGSDRG